tara:strand:- start:536 stop:880 length:345 start_codon:yes stop_codon:yes gene_type:complete
LKEIYIADIEKLELDTKAKEIVLKAKNEKAISFHVVKEAAGSMEVKGSSSNADQDTENIHLLLVISGLYSTYNSSSDAIIPKELVSEYLSMTSCTPYKGGWFFSTSYRIFFLQI